MRLLRDRFDRVVRLTEERLEHIREHPEVRVLEPLIAVVLEDPECVVESVSDPLVWLYYRRTIHATLGEKLFCVAVKGGWRDAFVLTAYVTGRAKRGRRVWPPDG